MIDTEIEAFLDHHGVKGQKWGVRNKVNRIIGEPNSRRRRTSKRIAVGIGIGSAALGAAFMAKRTGQNKKIAEFSNLNKRIREIDRELHFSRNLNSPFRSGLKDQLQNLKEQQLRKTIGEKHFKAIVLGPIGSTSVSRLRGAIPL